MTQTAVDQGEKFLREMIATRLKNHRLDLQNIANQLGVDVPVLEAFALGRAKLATPLLEKLPKIIWGHHVSYHADSDSLTTRPRLARPQAGFIGPRRPMNPGRLKKKLKDRVRDAPKIAAKMAMWAEIKRIEATTEELKQKRLAMELTRERLVLDQTAARLKRDQTAAASERDREKYRQMKLAYEVMKQFPGVLTPIEEGEDKK